MDYSTRAKQYNFATPEQVRHAIRDAHTHVLDVRTEEEIQDTGRIEHVNWRSTKCTPAECAQLEAHPEDFVADKDDTVVIYCASGRRASRAQAILESRGYQHVLNAGGYNDVVQMLQEDK